MALRRPKIPRLYPTVHGWWINAGAVQYIAHAITAGPAAAPLAGALAVGAGGGPNQHPDQQYWQAAPAVPGGIVRIEIDCTLMPCDGQYAGCLYRVPYLMRNAGFANVPLRIFSHRNEGLGGAGSSKRYFTCNSNDNNPTLTAAMAAQDGWGWVPWAGAYP